MNKIVALIVFIVFCSFNLPANDGGFYVNGNQLIPLRETDITVKKEILKIIRSRENPAQVNVSVYYEFYNPGESKTMIVGFEAASPSGDADISPQNGQQPYLHDFTVKVNNRKLPYEVAIVNDSVYKQQGISRTLTDQEIEENIWEGWADFMYVYHFQARFEKGLNIIEHTYTCDLSTFVMSYYEFGYLLSPALRWGNKQIDDFTMHIDMGEDQLIDIPKTFYEDVSEWKFSGSVKSRNAESPYIGYMQDYKSDYGKFYIKKGVLIFQKQNFRPKGELHISSPRALFLDKFDYREDKELLPGIAVFIAPDYMQADDSISRRILRNLPFAARGYIFSSPELREYYENQIWYFPNPDYKVDISDLSEQEQKWVQHWSE